MSVLVPPTPEAPEVEAEVGGWLAAGLVICAILVAGFGWLTREVIWEAHSTGIDRDISLAVEVLHSPARTQAARAFSLLADHRFLIPATVIFAILLVKAGHRVSAILFTGAVLGGFLLMTVLKISFGRARPDLWPALVTEKTYSFPSGHATLATVFYGGAVAVLFHLTRNRWARRTAVACAAPVIVSIAASRVYLGVHWGTDVVGGMLLGLGWVSLARTATEIVAGHFRRKKRLAAAAAGPTTGS